MLIERCLNQLLFLEPGGQTFHVKNNRISILLVNKLLELGDMFFGEMEKFKPVTLMVLLRSAKKLPKFRCINRMSFPLFTSLRFLLIFYHGMQFILCLNNNASS